MIIRLIKNILHVFSPYFIKLKPYKSPHTAFFNLVHLRVFFRTIQNIQVITRRPSRKLSSAFWYEYSSQSALIWSDMHKTWSTSAFTLIAMCIYLLANLLTLNAHYLTHLHGTPLSQDLQLILLAENLSRESRSRYIRPKIFASLQDAKVDQFMIYNARYKIFKRDQVHAHHAKYGNYCYFFCPTIKCLPG